MLYIKIVIIGPICYSNSAGKTKKVSLQGIVTLYNDFQHREITIFGLKNCHCVTLTSVTVTDKHYYDIYSGPCS